MENKILSVVIPSYNVERVIEKCVNSMLAADCGNDIEILAVNDGSTDNTEAILKKYTQQYPDTVRVISKENGGHGSAINTGIQNAAGKYFKVIDGDDWVDKDGFRELVEFLKVCKSDVVGTDFCFINENTGETKEDRCIKDTSKVKPMVEYRFDDIADSVLLQMHSLTIKTDILKNNNIKIDEKCFYVDVEYILLPIPYINTVVLMNKLVYMYRVGQLNQSVNIKNMQNRRDQHRKVMERMIKFLNVQKDALSVNKYGYIFYRLQDMLYMQYKIYLTMKGAKQEFVSFDKFLKANNARMYSKLFNQSLNKRITAGVIKFLRIVGYASYGLFNALYIAMEK